MPMADHTFDRSKPLYRLFDLETEDGARAWHVVGADNTPGDCLTEDETIRLDAYLAAQSWAPQFWEAFAKNKKATIYATKDFKGLVPMDLSGEIDGTLIHAVIYPWGGGGGYQLAHGYLDGVDRKGRFRHGESVTTSYLVYGPDENGIIRTRNSTYKLVLREDAYPLKGEPDAPGDPEVV